MENLRRLLIFGKINKRYVWNLIMYCIECTYTTSCRINIPCVTLGLSGRK